jgi:hypothetical protein
MPARRAGPDTRENPIRFKNLVSRAEEQLVEQGMRATLARDFAAPLRQLEADLDFWQHQGDGLAVFVREGNKPVIYRLPHDVEEQVWVASRFHIKPLLPFLAEGAAFYVLAISMNDTRVLHCTPHAEDEVKVPDMPRSMADALWPDDYEKQIQFRSFYTAQSGSSAEFHSAGSTEIDYKDALLRYFRQVDAALTPYLGNRRQPLLLACVAYLAPIYREANNYGELAEEVLTGNPELQRPDELRKAAWELMRPRLDKQREEAVGRYRSLAGTGLTVADPAEAALAALDGRVDTAFIDPLVERWGKVDTEAHTAEAHDEPREDDDDLLDFAAVHALNTGAAIYAVNGVAPEPSGIAAILRY